MFLGGEIDLEEAAGEFGGGFPTDLAAEAGFIAGGLEVGETPEEEEEDGFEEVPILGSAGEEGAKPEAVAFCFIEVEDGEVALTGSGDVEAEAEGALDLRIWIFGFGGIGEEGGEGFAKEIFDRVFALADGGEAELAKPEAEVIGFEVDALDGVVGAAMFDGRPFDDVIGGGTDGVAQVGLLEDFLITRASAAIGEELFRGKVRAADAVDSVDEAEAESVEDGDMEVEVPRGGGIFDF
jgi:hypothetical protein